MSEVDDKDQWYPDILDDITDEWKEFFHDNCHFLESAHEALSLRRTQIVPRGLEIFTAYRWTNPFDVKVILVGQDPYPQILDSKETKAVGASFSLRDYDKPTKSLMVIYKELRDDIEGFIIPKHGNLESWARQGVFLLNSSLTTDVGISNQHTVQWIEFVEATIRFLEENNPHLCYIMWGNEAKKLKAGSKHQKFCAAHPASRSSGFTGCRHFSKVNSYLIENNIEPINWKSICDDRFMKTKSARTRKD